MKKFREFFKNKKILITGNTGFKGSWLSQILINWGASVVGISLEPKIKPNLFTILELKKHLKTYFIDIRNIDSVKEIFSKESPEIVFHLAAQPIVRISYEDPYYTHTTNIIGTLNVIETIRTTSSIKSAVLITTDKVYEDMGWVFPYRENDKLGGHDPYSGSKAAADIVLNSYIKSFFNPQKEIDGAFKYIGIARAGNVIGGGDWSKYRLIPDIVRALLEKNETLVIRSPEAIRPWQHVLEPLYGYLTLARELYFQKKELVGAWNFGPDSSSFECVEDLVKKSINIFKRGKYIIEEDPNKHETHILTLDTTKTRTYLGWKPTMLLEECLNYTFSWYKEYYDGHTDMKSYTLTQINSFFNNGRGT